MKSSGQKVFQDLTGDRYGLVTVIDRAPNYMRTSLRIPGKVNVYARWLCKCDCGKFKIIRADSLRSRRALSCGCKQGNRPKKKKDCYFSGPKQVLTRDKENEMTKTIDQYDTVGVL